MDAEKIQEYLDKAYEVTLENDEWELFLLFALAYYMAWYSRWPWDKKYGFLNMFWKKRDFITFNAITPKWWSFRKTHIHLFSLFKKLWIEVDVNFSKKDIEHFINILNEWEREVFNHYDTKNTLVDRFINKEETTVFFSEFLFFFLEDKFYDWVEIKNNFNTDENIEKILALIDAKISYFVNWDLEKKFWVYSFDKQKEILLMELAKIQNIFWNMFKISEDNFWKKWEEQKFCYLYFFIFLFRNDYISIQDISPIDDTPIFDEQWNYECENEKYSLWIYLEPKINTLIDEWGNLKEKVLDKIFDTEYKQITIKKKNWELHSLEGEINIYWDDTKFIDLKNKYPYSKIETEIHNWNTHKYKITEKIKLQNDEN